MFCDTRLNQKITCSQSPKFMKSLLTSMSLVMAFQTNVLAEDIIYYINNAVPQSGGKAKLFAVDLALDQGRADLVLLDKLPIEGAHIAVTPDGSKVYLVDTEYDLAYYDVVGEEGYHWVGNITGNGERLAQAAFSPAGTLYIGSSATEEIYTLDLQTAEAISLGKISLPSGITLDLEGGDFAFVSNEVFYLLTNSENMGGLYKVTLGASLQGERIQSSISKPGEKFSGLAVLGGGQGDLIYSRREVNKMFITDRMGTLSSKLKLYHDGNEWETAGGDMTSVFDMTTLSTPVVHDSLKVMLTEFTATAVEGAIELQWTAIPEDTVAFRIWRGIPKGQICSQKGVDYSDISLLKESDDSDQPSLIWTTGDSRVETTYSYLDRHVDPRVTYCYVIEDLGAYSGSTYYLDFIPSATAR